VNRRRGDGAQKEGIIAVSCLSLLTAKIVFFELSGDYIRQDADYTVSPAGKKEAEALLSTVLHEEKEKRSRRIAALRSLLAITGPWI
jgi:hypothetical protein